MISTRWGKCSSFKYIIGGSMDFQEILDYAKHLDRSFFVDNEYKIYAEEDQPLPIGYGQTISQPSLVWQMTYLLKPDKNCTVLEIGTGSGYQTALLARFFKHVYSIERIPQLGTEAQKRLEILGCDNVTLKIGDGSAGWSEYAPFDRIMVTAAAGRMPSEFLQQLGKNGVMIIPIGPEGTQELTMVTKDDDGRIESTLIELVRFVEMKGKYGWMENWI